VAEVQQRCPGTRLVSVGDRESDIYELFHEALRDARGPWLLIRAEQDRRLAEGQQKLVGCVEQQPVAGIQEIQVPRHGKQPARVARLEVRFARVNLLPPKHKRSLDELTLWAVLSQEVEAPSGIAPVRWMLLTTCPVDSFEAACEKLHWYTLRWGIKVYHRTLKPTFRASPTRFPSIFLRASLRWRPTPRRRRDIAGARELLAKFGNERGISVLR
jgi:hypothetical protein